MLNTSVVYIKIKQLVEKDKIIYGTYGIHPHESKNDKVTAELIVNEVNKMGLSLCLQAFII